MTSQLPSDTPFRRVSPHVDLPAMDERILDLWVETRAFERSVEMRPAEAEYTFYDGPPFATGSPHYGHILQAIVKDIVPRYWTMQGRRVERRFGWDTHGLPVEMEVEKELDVSGPAHIEALGIATFNEACRAMVMETTGEWETITRRVGRWIDFANDYKTLDVEFMESVWWVFKSLWDKGLVYQDFKVLPYSWGATTPLSNFEANLDYRDVDDPAITVRLRVIADHGPVRAGDHLLIWTTTPWTLPGNLAVAVGADIDYVRLDGDVDGHPGTYWVSADRLAAYSDDPPAATVSGAELVGAEYEPPFDYFGEERDRGAFRVILSDDVATDEGTGLVHMAPAYGEADFLALQAAGLDVLVDPVDAQGRFTDAVSDVAGVNVKDADATLIRMMKEAGLIVRHERIRHSYPFCWRTDTPLIYKAIPTWFVAVETFRDRMVEVNDTIRWVPEAIGSRRFGNWLAGARDWAISRNRYWGSCIPVWQCDACDEQVCIGSREDLEQRSGVWLDDIHRHFVDEVTFPCTACEGTMVRIPEVLDCWFESGSMPYAQIHYPFENEDRFKQRYPADFIAEGIDQTRGWFYTLVVLATALEDKAPFQNCIVTGHIMAEDGLKMSKRLKNYPDPVHVLDEFGADALRAYLINSPVVRGDNLRFSESGVREVVRTVLLPFWNAYSFFTTYAEADGVTAEDLAAAPPVGDRPEIDRWIVSVLQSLVRDITREMSEYRLFAVIPPMLGFIDDLTNWYIRRSRRRFWRTRATDDSDKLAAFATLYEVLVTFATAAAPVLPFITEELHQGLVKATNPSAPDSIHLVDYPTPVAAVIDEQLEAAMAIVRTVVNLGHGLRKQHDLKVRQPLHELTVITRDAGVREAVESHLELIANELNVKKVEVHGNEDDLMHLSAKADFKVLGPRLGSRMREVAAAIAALDHATVSSLIDGDSAVVGGETITAGDVVVVRDPRPGFALAAEGPVSVALETELTPDLIAEGIAREVVNRIQSVRRSLDLAVSDRVVVTWYTNTPAIADAVELHGDLISGEVLATGLVRGAGESGSVVDVNGHAMWITVSRDD